MSQLPQRTVLKQEVAKARKTKKELTSSQQTQVIRSTVERLSGRSLEPIDVAEELAITEALARGKSLRVMRRHLAQMIGRFKKGETGAPRLEWLRADAPIEEIIEAYEWYHGKCTRLAVRWNQMGATCHTVLTRLRRKRKETMK